MNSSIDTLPLDALVQILCKLNHDELRPLISVSKLFHDAACVAQRMHFDFATPAPRKTPALPWEMDETPVAPPFKMESRKLRKSMLSEEETRRIAVALFPLGDRKRERIPRQKWELHNSIRSHLGDRGLHVYHASA